MTLRIIHTTYGPHRDTRFIGAARIHKDDDLDDRRFMFFIDDINYAILQLADEKWWLAPNNAGDEEKCVDYGPYDSAEDAAAMLKLKATKVVLDS